MTLRRVTAQRVDTFVQQSRGGIAAANERTRQVGGVLQQLGVVVGEKRERDFNEAAKEVQADARTRARNLEANHRASLESALARPETYEGTAEDFLKSDEMKAVYDELDTMPYPEHRKKFREQMDDMVLRKYGEGATRHEYLARDRQASLSQQTAAKSGIESHMQAYDDSLAVGIEDDDTFVSALATAVQQDVSYMKQFATAREWTPEQRLKIKQELKRMTTVVKAKKDSEFGYLKKLMGKPGMKYSGMALNAAYALRDRKSDMMSEAEIGGLNADIQFLEKQNAEYGQAAELLQAGASSQQLVSSGKFFEIGDAEIKEVHNELYAQAKAEGPQAVAGLLKANPHNLPSAYQADYKAFVGGLSSIGPGDNERRMAAEKQWSEHAQIMEELGPYAMETLMKHEAPRMHVFNANVRLTDFNTAVQSLQRWDENKAQNGGRGLQVDRKVADSVREDVLDDLDIPAGQHDLVANQINRLMNNARQYGIRDESDLKAYVAKGVNDVRVEGVPNSVPFLMHMDKQYPQHEMSLNEGIEFVRRQIGLGGIEVPKDADVFFDPTNPGKGIYFTNPETGSAYHPQALDAHAILAEYFENNTIPTRKERNVDVVRTRKQAAERNRSGVLKDSFGGSTL